MSRLKSWWSQPDQFDWVTAFLRQRDLFRPAGVILAIVSASAAGVPLTVLATQRHPGVIAIVVGALTVVFSLGSVYFWLTRWPTRLQSRIAAVSGMLSTAGWSLVQPSPVLAALACMVMAVTGGYMALFHSPRLALLNIIVAVATATVAVFRLAAQADVATAAAAFWLIGYPNVAVPLIIWGASQAMGSYVQRARQDPLTGLLNRRAFTEAVTARLVEHEPAHTHLAVLMLDLDDFKRINDTDGHLAGDRLLQVVAGLLRDHSPAGAIVCRAGGEEFLVALTTSDHDVTPIGSTICAAIAKHPSGITASVGTASAELRLLSAGDAVLRADGADLIDELVARADSAMYMAKRLGGNQARQSAGS